MDSPGPAARAPGPRADEAPAPLRTRAEALRARVLFAAAECFNARGVGKVRMGEVAEAAGVSRALLYKYFGDKGGLLAALNDTVIEDYRALMSRLFAPGRPVAPALRRWLSEALGNERRLAFLHVLMSDEARRQLLAAPRGIRRVYAETRRLLAAALRRGVESGELRPDLDVERTALALQVLHRGLVREWGDAGIGLFGAELRSPEQVSATVGAVVDGLVRKAAAVPAAPRPGRRSPRRRTRRS
jgi:AcrR family transcriptional regulator